MLHLYIQHILSTIRLIQNLELNIHIFVLCVELGAFFQILCIFYHLILNTGVVNWTAAIWSAAPFIDVSIKHSDAHPEHSTAAERGCSPRNALSPHLQPLDMLLRTAPVLAVG